MQLESIIQYVDEYLGVSGFPDYSGALNGLQVAGRRDISTVVTAVDATMASIEAALEREADLMIVHHGLFWDGLRPVTGRHYRRLEALLTSGTALYSCHLPLDAHVEVGNCMLLARAIDIEPEGRLGEYGGAPLGWWGRLPIPLSPEELARRVTEAVGGSPVRILDGGPERIDSIGVLTGGGGSFVREAASLGLDAYVTGEASHHTFFDAEEFGIHVILAGHYATETFGVRALGDMLERQFGLTHHFVDRPTGL